VFLRARMARKTRANRGKGETGERLVQRGTKKKIATLEERVCAGSLTGLMFITKRRSDRDKEVEEAEAKSCG